MANQKERLLTEFAPISTQEWMDKITADLKGADFAKKLVWRTNEGFNVNPFYRREDLEGLTTPHMMPAEYPYVRSTRMDNDWLIRQDINASDLKAANAKALDVLGKGINSLGFKLKKDQINVESLQVLLKDILPEAIELNFTCCISVAAKLAGVLTEYFATTGADVAQCKGSIAFDPFKKQLVRGISNPNWVENCKTLLEAAKGLPQFRVLTVNALNLNNAGAYIYQELGYALSWGAELLDKLTAAGYSLEEVTSRIKFVFGVGSNYFMELAKFRAARWLWAEIVGAYGEEYRGEVAKIHQQAVTSTWNKTIFDAHVNLLRTQTEAMSATLGGVDSLTVQPFDVTYQESDDFSERIARNQQLLLKEECHFDKVIDPAAGSYYVEYLTNSIATEAWKLFLAVEEEGGFAAAVEAGSVQKAVNTSNDKRHAAVAARKEIFLGTNQFPNFTEVAAGKIKIEEEGPHTCGCGEATIEKLNFSRGASDFEALRLATERSGKEVKVFMLTIGNLAMRLARSQFSSNFFACAGYKVIDNLGFKTVQEGVDAGLAAGADIIVLCSSDDEYAEFAPEAFKYLDGRAQFVVAGAPACTDDLKAIGINNFINVKSNVLETLRGFNQVLGIN
ncbi:methylmalonyl-CoA mutase small subunit [Porphyromonas sp. COT-290 OH3588]|uniref:methylmalonyl-CoA mutase small subunit n=1 Tax=Porphyromonas sp. COT-290 OH3588 TaxID=1515617 RepID=UPI00052E2DB2|nr:methylmalonyl-CoA mutase small subunit [Porphyromonas sp. COT-290 OH3588]KGO01751.1 methylmalonyl-CoA mutase [Porphyromonas sp. COT-290 OH3588]